MPLLVFGILGFIAVVLGLFLLYRVKRDAVVVGSFIAILCYFLTYISIRTAIASIRGPLMTSFDLDAASFSRISSVFSMAYGLMQFFSGYLLSRFRTFGVAFFAIMTGVFAISLSFQNSVMGLIICRFFMGIFCSTGAIGYQFYLTSYWPSKYFPFLMGLGIFLAYQIGSVVTFFSDVALSSKVITWKQLIFYFGLLGLIVGFVIMAFSFLLKKTEDNGIEETKETEESSSFVSFIKRFFKNRTLVLMGLYSWLMPSLYFIMQDGYGSYVIDQYFKSMPSGTLTFLLNSGIGWASIALPVLTGYFSPEGLMLVCSVAQIFGIIIFLVGFSSSFSFLVISTFIFSIAGAAHLLPQCLAGMRFKGKTTGFLFGAMNFFAMMLGCSLSQFLAGIVLKIFWKNSGSVVVNSAPFYSASNIASLVSVLIVPASLSLIIAIFLYRDRNKPINF